MLVVLLIVVIVASVVLSILTAKKQKLKIVFLSVALVAAIVVGYFLIVNVMRPINFQNEKNLRYNKVVDKLKDIRKAQESFKRVHRRYTASFDTLTAFIKDGKIPVVKKVGSMSDSLAKAQGKVKRDTLFLSAFEETFPKGCNLDSLSYIPFSKDKEFRMGSKKLKTSGTTIEVCEVRAFYRDFLFDLDEVELNTFLSKEKKKEKYKNDEFLGLKFGSMTEANNNTGNWESL